MDFRPTPYGWHNCPAVHARRDRPLHHAAVESVCGGPGNSWWAEFEGAYAEAARFVEQAFVWASERGGDTLGPSDRVLDFGSGWGRITRMLLTRHRATQLYCLDVDPEMTALVQSTLPGVNALTGSAFPPSALGTGTMAQAYAFSVFSHLAEEAHAQWAGEFGRLLTPGGLAFITVLDELFSIRLRGAGTGRARDRRSVCGELGADGARCPKSAGGLP